MSRRQYLSSPPLLALFPLPFVCRALSLVHRATASLESGRCLIQLSRVAPAAARKAVYHPPSPKADPLQYEGLSAEQTTAQCTVTKNFASTFFSSVLQSRGPVVPV
ncbi:hypothetical protein V5799_023755 [Amblyomma americanum]|uniref:Secreted protein n=1 Tax=Amblyomma americanum TaxID=6943 RepID=A0AAQ4FGY3_AMBAM